MDQSLNPKDGGLVPPLFNIGDLVLLKYSSPAKKEHMTTMVPTESEVGKVFKVNKDFRKDHQTGSYFYEISLSSSESYKHYYVDADQLELVFTI